MLARLAEMLQGDGWTPAKIGDLAGRHYAITGGNSGLGLEAARILTGKGAKVTLLCRNPAKAQGAIEDLARAVPRDRVATLALDLASLASVREAAAALRASGAPLDGLLNNAGLMALPERQTTADGLEMQLGVNFFGHFALSGLLCDRVEEAAGRFVIVSSLAHKFGKLNFDDLQSQRSYGAWPAYAQSKLADLVFALELDRRLRAAGCKARAVACHPGYSATNLQTTGPSALEGKVMAVANSLIAQSAERGAWPEVLAAADATAESGAYYGPIGAAEMMGPVGKASIAHHARRPELGPRLWAEAERLTGVTWPILAKA